MPETHAWHTPKNPLPGHENPSLDSPSASPNKIHECDAQRAETMSVCMPLRNTQAFSL